MHEQKDLGSDEAGNSRERRAGKLWRRVLQRIDKGKVTSSQEPSQLEPLQLEVQQNFSDTPPPLVHGITEEVGAAIAARRRRLDARLGASLKQFRSEVLEEANLQASEAKERQKRLKERRQDILSSLEGLQDDILEEIEAVVSGMKRSSETIERGIRELRNTWEDEVGKLIEEAKQDIELAVADLEVTIDKQRDEWRHSIELFEKQYERGFLFPSSTNRTSNVTLLLSRNVTSLLSRSEIKNRLREIQANVAEIGQEIEEELQLFKRRWAATTSKIETLPVELRELRTLADLRRYVGDTLSAGRVPALLSRRNVRGASTLQKPSSDPLGLRRLEADNLGSAVLTPTPASNLRLPGRCINIVTTAALPWMTGTSINPLLRAAHLAMKGYKVSLVLPWLPIEEQEAVFPAGLRFERPINQEQYIRWWCENKANVDASNLKLRWYRGSYRAFLGSIIQHECDIALSVPKEDRDVVILEEPEHLNWYHHGAKWTHEYRHVVGIAHTNYLQYSRLNNKGTPGFLKEATARVFNLLVCHAYTDVVVKLSATLDDMGRTNLVCNVHGVRSEFLAIGAASKSFPSGAYFLGKALYTKGYRELFDILCTYASRNPGGLQNLAPIHTYGSGPDQDKIRAEALDKGLCVDVRDGIDHAHPSLHGYKVFINPSTSDVLCTATAEALAMGKKVLIPDHPSNEFFKQFTNTIAYNSTDQVIPLLMEALQSEPAPLSAMEQYMLSWEAATERLLDAAALPAGTRRASTGITSSIAYALHYIVGVQPIYDILRIATGAGAVGLENPHKPSSYRAI